MEKNNNEKELKKNKESSWFKTKKTFYGIGKEFKRISWPTLRHVLWGFLVTFILTSFLVLLFYIVSDILVAAHIINAVKSSANNSTSTA